MTAHGEKRSTLAILQEFSVPLIAGVILAVIWANVDPVSYAKVWGYSGWSPFGPKSHLNLHFLSNDIVMVFFFGIAAKEITEACLPGGALNPPRKAINPLLGTIGGVVGPVGTFFVMMKLLGEL